MAYKFALNTWKPEDIIKILPGVKAAENPLAKTKVMDRSDEFRARMTFERERTRILLELGVKLSALMTNLKSDPSKDISGIILQNAREEEKLAWRFRNKLWDLLKRIDAEEKEAKAWFSTLTDSVNQWLGMVSGYQEGDIGKIISYDIHSHLGPKGIDLLEETEGALSSSGCRNVYILDTIIPPETANRELELARLLRSINYSSQPAFTKEKTRYFSRKRQ